MKLHSILPALAPALLWGGIALAGEPAEEVPPAAFHPGHGQVGKVVEVEPGVFVMIAGADDRSRLRMKLWIASLAGDRGALFEELGKPNSRHFELEAGRHTEHWTYLEPAFGEYTYLSTGSTFIFSGNDLLEVRRF